MKIATAGSHGVGKTTFAQALAEKLGYKYLPDMPREEAVKKGFKISEGTSFELQLWLTTQQWMLEKTTPDSWVADKCLFDYLVYGELLFDDEELNNIIRRVVEPNANYDLVFYIPIMFPMQEDGLRSKKLQPKVDAYYKEYLDKRGIKYITISSSVKEDRIKQALSYIKK
jgi:nicotinamide riboside kinase